MKKLISFLMLLLPLIVSAQTYNGTTSLDAGTELIKGTFGPGGVRYVPNIVQTSIANGQLMKYDSALKKWVNFTPTYISSEADPIYSASSWFGTTNNSANWNTAFGWGNHASVGYTTASNTQTFTNKSGNISQWTNNAGYISAEADPIYSASSWFGTTNNSANWNSAFTDRLKWDGGSSGLVAATGRSSLGLVIGSDVLAYRTFGTAANNNTGDFYSTGSTVANSTLWNGVAYAGPYLTTTGTGSSLTDVVHLSGTQTIPGAKTFSAAIAGTSLNLSGTIAIGTNPASSAAGGLIRMPYDTGIRWRNSTNTADIGFGLGGGNLFFMDAGLSVGGVLNSTGAATFGGNVAIGSTNTSFAPLRVSNGNNMGLEMNWTGGTTNGFIQIYDRTAAVYGGLDFYSLNYKYYTNDVLRYTIDATGNHTWTGTATFSNIAGSGDRFVVANSSGTLITATIGTGLSYTGGVLSATGGSSGTVTGSGTAGFLAKFNSASDIGNSIMSESSSNINIAGSLSVSGSVANRLSLNSTADVGYFSLQKSGVDKGYVQWGINQAGNASGNHILISNATASGSVFLQTIGHTDALEVNSSGNTIINGSQTVSGDISANSKLLITSPTSPSSQGQYGYNSQGGTYIWTKGGSASDFTLYNKNGAEVIQIPTGTQSISIPSSIAIGSTNTTFAPLRISDGVAMGLEFSWQGGSTNGYAQMHNRTTNLYGGFDYYLSSFKLFTGSATPLLRYTLDVSGNNSWTGSGVFGGSLSASNFSGSSSGTNTGDQTNISGNAATATTADNSILWNGNTISNVDAASVTYVIGYDGVWKYYPIGSLKTQLGLTGTNSGDQTWSTLSGKPSFAAVATSGAYSDLSGTPTIPTNTNQLTNGAGFITGINSGNVTTALGYTPVNPSSLSTVASSGSYTNLTDKPLVPSMLTGSVSESFSSQTTTTISGFDVSGTSYRISIAPTNSLSAAPYYVTNKTNTSFDVVYTSAKTGTISFDWTMTINTGF